MNFYDLLFYVFAALTLGSAGVMVFSKNVVYSAVGLLFSLSGVAGIYVFLAADFIAVVQVLIYVGGILILLLFGVMLSQKVTGVALRTETMRVVPAILVVGGVLFILVRMFMDTPWVIREATDFSPTTDTIGTLMMTDYLIPFEIASVLLLGALIGAAFIARKDS